MDLMDREVSGVHVLPPAPTLERAIGHPVVRTVVNALFGFAMVLTVYILLGVKADIGRVAGDNASIRSELALAKQWIAVHVAEHKAGEKLQARYRLELDNWKKQPQCSENLPR